MKFIHLGFNRPVIVVRLWTPAIRITWPIIRASDGFGLGQDTTQVGFSWPPGPRRPRWREVRR